MNHDSIFVDPRIWGPPTWYIIHTLVNNETKALYNLSRQNFLVYMPKYKKVINHARKIKTVFKPLFPRYLFVHFDINNAMVIPSLIKKAVEIL